MAAIEGLGERFSKGCDKFAGEELVRLLTFSDSLLFPSLELCFHVLRSTLEPPVSGVQDSAEDYGDEDLVLWWSSDAFPWSAPTSSRVLIRLRAESGRRHGRWLRPPGETHRTAARRRSRSRWTPRPRTPSGFRPQRSRSPGHCPYTRGAVSSRQYPCTQRRHLVTARGVETGLVSASATVTVAVP